MLFQKVITKKTSFVFLIIAGLFLADINITKAVGWTPLTDLSSFGIPAGPISLSDFIIFVYDFLLSAVGIAAMLMIVLGGFRYLTAAGNAASLTEAKDIIYNALYGLALAICAWIIISTINPDLIYLKKPGADVTHLNYSCLGPEKACNTCNGGDGCDSTCPVAPAAGFDPDCDPVNPPMATANCCNGTCSAASGGTCPDKPIFCADSMWPITGVDGNCKCIDGTEIPIVAGQDCSDTCRPNNCLVAIAMIDAVGSAYAIPNTADKKYVSTYINLAGCTETVVFDAYKSVVQNTPITCEWDFESDGIYENFNCFTSFCPIPTAPGGSFTATLRITDSLGNQSIDTVRYSFIKI